MTDITELAQRMKAAAEKATPGNWRAFQYHDGRCGVGGGNHDEIMVCEHISKKRPHDAVFIALANPANVLALVDTLEQAQQHETQASEMAVQLSSRLTSANKRIAELESKLANPVQLPKTNGYWTETEKAYEEAITLAKRQVRLAGFIVEDM